jgi:hypothetical protein
MVPLFTELIEPFQKALDELLDSLAEGRSVSPPPDLAPTRQASNSEIADAWLEIAFGLLRDARQNYDAARWNQLKAKIDKVVQRYRQHTDGNHYEAALWATWNVERGQAKAIISNWQPSPRSPLAVMRKAGLLAELDELGEARTILRQALLEIRRALRNQGRNIELLSLEGWCTYLLYAVESSLDFTRRSTLLDEFRERWEELKAWHCSPWTHKEYFDEVLSATPPKPQKVTQEVRGFDPGQVTLSVRFGGDNIRPYLPAFACIRLYERVGMPMRLPMLNIAGDTLKNACRWIAPFIGFWSPALLIRAGKLDDLTKDDFLNRTQVAAMDPALARRLYVWCKQILERELASLTGLIPMYSAKESALEVLPEVLSRLAFKVDAAELRRTFPLALYFHRQPGVRSHIRLHESCEPWFQRLFDAADEELLLEWLPDLIKGALFDEGVHPVTPGTQAWPDPMRHFPNQRVAGPRGTRPDLLAKVNEATDWLLRRASSEIGEGRRRAVNRLAHIYAFDASLLTADQQRRFGELLWSERAASNLPDLPGFAIFGFLHLPAPASVDVPSLVKNHILTLTVHGAVSQDALGRTTIMHSDLEQPLIFEASLASKPIVQLVGEAWGSVEWTQQEAKQLYQKARDWWANDKKAFESAERPGFGLMGTNPVLKTLRRLGQFLARVVLPRMEWADENEWQQLLGWLQEIRGVGAFPTVALPYILLKRPAEAETVEGTITADLNSDEEDGVVAAAKAVRHWFHLSAMGRISAPAPSMITALIERVLFRRRAGAWACVKQLAYLVLRFSKTYSHMPVFLVCFWAWQENRGVQSWC